MKLKTTTSFQPEEGTFSDHNNFGRGKQHGSEILPPAMKSIQVLTSAICSWVTAEIFVGNLDSLRKNNP